jgi:hypothetical protein
VDGSANVDIELAGLVQGTEYDFINISGLAELDGTLAVQLLNGFLPDIGDSFEIMRWGTRSGEFASMFGLDLGPSLFLQPHYTSTSLMLVAATAPIPEPETWAMMLAGLGLMGFLARRRRRGRPIGAKAL